MAIVLDLAMLLILVFCIWQGKRKGLVLTVVGVVSVFLSAFIAGRVAGAFAQPVSESIYPIMQWLADDAIEEAAKESGGRVDEANQNERIEIAQKAYEILGIHTKESDKMLNMAKNAMANVETKIRDAIAKPVLYSFSYMILCVFVFALSMIGLTLIKHLLSTVVKLPVLHTLDTAGGILSGAIYGILILSSIGWAARFFGIVIPTSILENTFLLKFFVNFNLLSWIMGFR